MIKKLLKLDNLIKEELKDPEFKKLYEEEGKKLEIGYKIAKLRHKKGMTQKDLAKKTHTTQTVISRLEKGSYWTCSIKTLEKIALATGTHLNRSFRK